MQFNDVDVVGWPDLRWRGRGQFELLNSLHVSGICEGEWFSFNVPKGLITDLASVPKIARWIVSKTDLVMASIVHDWLYVIRFHRGRLFADELFRYIGCTIDEQPQEAEAAYKAVRLFGKEYWDND